MIEGTIFQKKVDVTYSVCDLAWPHMGYVVKLMRD